MNQELEEDAWIEDETACWICSICLHHSAEPDESGLHPNRYNPVFQCDGRMHLHTDWDRHLAVVIVKRWCEKRISAVASRLDLMADRGEREFIGADGTIWTSKKIRDYKSKIEFKLTQANLDLDTYASRGITNSIAELEFEFNEWSESDVTAHREVDVSVYTYSDLLPTRERVLERPLVCAECGTTTHIDEPLNPVLRMHHRGDAPAYMCWNSQRELKFADLIAANTGWDDTQIDIDVYRIKDGRVMSELFWQMYGQNGFDEWDRSDPNTAG